MVPWKTLQSLAIFFGPLLLPRAIAFYRSVQSRPKAQIRPLPTKTSYALGILFLSAVVAFISTFPVFIPPNIFRLTQSRLQTSGGVLLTRLSALRSPTPEDERLRQVFDAGGLDARLLYARFGPRVVDCPFAQANEIDANWNYLIYATPFILAPHLLHLIALGIATSTTLSASQGAKWRTVATIAGLVLGAAEYYFIATYDSTSNARSTRINEIDFIYWKMQVYRGLAIAAVDAALGWVIWLQATGRAFLSPPSAAERVAGVGQGVEVLLNKLRSLGMIRNAVVRDAASRRQVDAYWVKEGEVMKDVFEEQEVLDAQRSALRRIDVAKVSREAENYLDGIFGGLAMQSGQAPG